MSIRDRANSYGNTVTSVNRALELFTNRNDSATQQKPMGVGFRPSTQPTFF